VSTLATRIGAQGLVQVARPPDGTGRAARRSNVPRGAHRYLGVVVVLALWQVASSTGLLNPQDLAGPFSVLRAGWDLTTSGVLPGAVWV
jgi:sulfonate transport system permease protein